LARFQPFSKSFFNISLGLNIHHSKTLDLDIEEKAAEDLEKATRLVKWTQIEGKLDPQDVSQL
jgi:hypothetical protein